MGKYLIQRGAPWQECVIEDDDGCLIWQGHINRDGYGQRGAGRLAHRLIYEIEVAPIPAGLTLDHLCRKRPCVNPSHLEPVTIQENLLRGRRRNTHCINGHEYTAENSYFSPAARRECRQCVRDRVRRYKARRRLS